MGIIQDLDKIEKKMLEIKEFARETVEKMIELNMTYDDYDYFRTTMNNEVDSRPIGRR